MIRLVFALRKKDDLSRDEFQEYWLRKHAPLVAGFQTDLNIHRYVQTHTLTSPLNEAGQAARGNMEPKYDGVAELWWESEDELAELIQTEPARVASGALLEDERQFIDLRNSPLWFSYEYPQVNPTPEDLVARVKSNIVRVFFPLRHQQSISEEKARHYWLTQHGPIVRAHAQAAGVLCYRQVHHANSPLDAGLREARGTVAAPYLGHAEAWMDLGNALDTEAAAAAGAALLEDEHKFIDMNRSTIFYGKEHTIVDHR